VKLTISVILVFRSADQQNPDKCANILEIILQN